MKYEETCASCGHTIRLPKVGERWVSRVTGHVVVIDGEPREGRGFYWSASYACPGVVFACRNAHPGHPVVGGVAVWCDAVRHGDWRPESEDLDALKSGEGKG